ncbi:hypothetical protein DPMN_059188 [Dreissena polymorpha]|uniref:Uncharacterized protein n=1 Tax=Dreissena polymorpha TaxID=45954 RepID=A0A9D4HEP8_DREPO|nr:hypothetical protein DPMN_059188 [Dreissena polymorpha]
MEDEHDTNTRTVYCLPGMPALPRETGTRNKRDYSLISSSFTTHPNVEVGVCIDVCLIIWVR